MKQMEVEINLLSDKYFFIYTTSIIYTGNRRFVHLMRGRLLGHSRIGPHERDKEIILMEK